MFETSLTVIGRIVTDPIRRRVGDQEVVKFRLASNARRRTGEGTWEPGNSLYISVNCWGKLVTGVSASLTKGDAVIVVGHVYTSEYEDREGARRSSCEMRATAVGPDLTRYIARIDKVPTPGEGAAASDPAASDPAASDPAAADPSTAGTSGGADDVDDTEDDPDSDDAGVAARVGLPLSA